MPPLDVTLRKLITQLIQPLLYEHFKVEMRKSTKHGHICHIHLMLSMRSLAIYVVMSDLHVSLSGIGVGRSQCKCGAQAQHQKYMKLSSIKCLIKER